MTAKLVRVAALIVSLGLVVLWGSLLDWSIVLRGDNDFAMLYAGAKTVGTVTLYLPAEFQQVQKQFANVHGERVLYARLPYYALLLKPLASLPYSAAYLVFTLLNFAALAVFLRWFTRGVCLKESVTGRSFPWLVGVISVPVLTAFVSGQDILLVLLICAAAAALVRRDSRFLAGGLLSLCSIKPHLFLLLPVMLAVRREWKILAGGAAGGAILFAISTAAQGWGWPAAYFDLLGQVQDAAPYTMPNLRGVLTASIGENLKVELALALVVMALVAWAAWRIRDFDTAFAVAIAGGLLTSHHAYIQDCSLLLVIAALAKTNIHLRVGALILMTPPFYFLLSSGPVSLLLPLGIGVLVVSTVAEDLV